MIAHEAQERATFWRVPALENLELLKATFVTHAFAPHTHEGFAIGVLVRGAERFTYRRQTYVAPLGSIVVINPGEIHTGEAAGEEGWSYRMLYPEADLLRRAASQMVGREREVPFFSAPVIHDSATASALLDLHQRLEHSDSTLERQSSLLWALAQLIARHADDRPVPRLMHAEQKSVDRVRDYLEERYAENVTLDDLARFVNLSPYHLLRLFRQQTGLPPHAYLTQVRVRRARSLLRAGVPIAETALQVGFTDQSHLSRHFKRTVGVPPGQYARASKIVQDG